MRIRNNMFAMALMLVASTAWAGKAEDFKAAVAAGPEGGCRTIPYSDMQSDCSSRGSTMHEWCDGKRGPVSCRPVGTSRNLTSALEREKKRNDELKDKKRNLEDKKSRSSDDNEKSKLTSEIEAVDKEIYAQGKVIEQAEKDLRDRKELINNAIYTIEKCIDHRRAVMNLFASAQDKVRGESDDSLREDKQKLLGYYNGSKNGHEIAIRDKENALSTCKDERL
jgi:hypothetical protein